MKKTLALLLVFLFGALYMGCSDNSTDPNPAQEKGGVQFKIDKANAPANVVSVEAIMISEYSDTLRAIMDMTTDTSATITFTDIAAGAWYLTVNAYSRDSVLLYTGYAEIKIEAGIITNISLVLEPTGLGTGSVLITVTWGTPLVKTITIQPGPEGKDALINYFYPDTNRGSYEDFIIYSGTFDGDYNAYRCLLEFNLSFLQKGAKIKSAVLQLYYNPTSGFDGGGQNHSGENAFYVRRIIEDWAENTVTWNNQPMTDTTDFVYVPKSEIDTQDYTIDITSLVQSSVNEPANSHGFLFSLANEQPYAHVMLYSGDAPYADRRPKLTIKYEQ